MYNKFKQLGKESIIYGVGGVASGLISILLLPLYTRIFNPSEYGVVDVIVTTTSLAAIVLTAGTDTALSFHFFKYPEQNERKRTISSTAIYLLLINTIVAIIVWILADAISNLIFATTEYATYLRIAILSIPFTALFTMNLNVLRLERKPWAFLGLSIPRIFLTLLLNIFLVVILEMGIMGVFLANFIVALLATLLGIIVNRKYYARTVDQERLKLILKYGLPLVIGGLSIWSINYLDRYFLLRYEGLDQIGVYSVGLKYALSVALVTRAFRLANSPFQFEVSTSPQAREIYSRSLTYYVIITSMICVPVCLYAIPALRIITTELYSSAYTVVPFAVYAIVAYGAAQLVGVGLLITRRTGISGTVMGVGALANVLYLILLVPALGIIGAALATLLAYVTLNILQYINAQRFYRIPYDLRRVAAVLILAWMVIGIGIFIENGELIRDILIASLFTVLFFIIIYMSPILRQDEKNVLKKGLRNIARDMSNLAS